MPELPEVETIRRTLEARLRGLRIQSVEPVRPRFIRFPTAGEFRARVEGSAFTAFGRRGKYLILTLSTGDRMVVHLRMTGRLIYARPGDPRPKHTHLVFHLSDGGELRYVDQRTFGGVTLAGPTGTALPPSLRGLEELGVEPLSPDFTVERLRRALGGRRGRIKGLLLDQRLIAGLGNIYADEALFRARVHPLRPAGSLRPPEVAALHRAIGDVLRQAIEMNGTTFYSYVDGEGNRGDMARFLDVYGREGQPCRACGRRIEVIRAGGRGARFCPGCQRAGKRVPRAGAGLSGARPRP